MLLGRKYLTTCLLGLAALSASCGAQDKPEDCSGDRCSSAETREELLAQLAGFSDPISEFLRTSVREDGSLEGDYRAILSGVGDLRDCDEDRTRSFMVLSNEALNPKTVLTTCSDAPTLASEFFLLLPTLAGSGDFEPRVVHMTAWDAEAGEYRRFATSPRAGGGMGINVQPAYCLSCHAGPHQLGAWQPLMNEMTNPWSQWNAEPGFRSHVFDENLREDTQNGDVFAEVSAVGLADSASNFEPIFRAGIDRVTGSRLQTRHRAANIDEALELLQPLFCDEQVNYVSEIHRSGEIRSAVLIDDANRELLSILDADEAPFVREDTLRIAPPGDNEENLTLVTVRGESSLRSELALVARQVIAPIDALRVRSMDWMRPVASAFRCELFTDGAERIRNGATDAALDALPQQATNADLLSVFLPELMTFETREGRISLIPTDDEEGVFSLPDVDLVDFADLTVISPVQLADQMQAVIDSASRETMNSMRRDRACAAANRYLVAPIFPDIDC